MATTDIFEKLKKLQTILVKKYELEQKIEEAPKQLGSQEELLSRMKKEYIEKNNEYETVKTNVGKLKLDLDEAVKSRENGEKGMDNIQTHREYEALEKQINEATERENEIRKDLQKEEKILEEIKETLKINEDMITAQENDLASSKESLNNELQSYNKELTSLKKSEDKITPDLDQEILFKFQRIIQRNSEGIVAVRNGVCTGCHMILPAQFANIVREGENINFCPYCSRILFYEETGEEEAYDTYYNFEETGSLADLDDDLGDEAFEDEEEREEKLYDEGDEDLDNEEDEEDAEENADEDSDEDDDEEESSEEE
ncbi:MAG: nucleic acid-binding protein [Treponema sp.]|nr:nucleic acid-binding protein [Treponema sp.]